MRMSRSFTFSRCFTSFSRHFVTKASPLPSRSLPPSFNYRDPLSLECLLTEEEKMISETAHEYALHELLPRVIAANRQGTFDRKIMKEMGQLGLLGLTLTSHNCAGSSSVAYGLVAREIERVDSGYRSAMSVQSSLVMQPISDFGSEEMKDKWLPLLAKGEAIGCFGLTEPDHGSDPAGMETRAVKDGTDYIISGSKTWITNAPIADVAIVWCKDEGGKIAGFLLERDMKGVSLPEIKGKLSLRASITGQIVMEEVRVPAANKLNVSGMRGPFSCLNSARFGIAFGSIGAAEFCIEVTRQYLLDRRQFDAPLAAQQLIQAKLADGVSELGLALNAAIHVGRLKDQGRALPEQISLIKRNSCIKSLNVARDCRDMLGGNGISEDYHVMRHMLNLETVNTYEGTNSVHTLILGKAITGIPAFVAGTANSQKASLIN